MTELALRKDAIPLIRTSAERSALSPAVHDRIYYLPSLCIQRYTGTAWARDVQSTAIVTLGYSATVGTDASAGGIFELEVTDTSAFTMSAPIYASQGAVIRYAITNSSGGSMGTITWDSVFKLAGAFTNPANGKIRTIEFYYDGTNWVELTRGAADI
jgi:hypothetical protein